MSKKKSRPLAMLLTGMLWCGLSHAQVSSNSSGGNAIGAGGTVSYTIGQLDYTTNTGSTGNINQGVQHAYEIFTLGIVESTRNFALIAYPNPTIENLTLQISNFNNERFSYQLYDTQGKLLKSGQITSDLTEINTSSLTRATYFINVVNQENKKVQSFKIIKN
jgi:hypothetical protein